MGVVSGLMMAWQFGTNWSGFSQFGAVLPARCSRMKAKLPASGKYTVLVFQTRATARKGSKVPHTLTVSVK